LKPLTEAQAATLSMTPTRNRAGLLLRGWVGDRDRREGRRQRIIRRLLIAAGGKPVSGLEMISAIYPGQAWGEWRWAKVRESASRYAVRIEPRTRPLCWRLKPDGMLMSLEDRSANGELRDI
jgi:hypothetical protein